MYHLIHYPSGPMYHLIHYPSGPMYHLIHYPLGPMYHLIHYPSGPMYHLIRVQCISNVGYIVKQFDCISKIIDYTITDQRNKPITTTEFVNCCSLMTEIIDYNHRSMQQTDHHHRVHQSTHVDLITDHHNKTTIHCICNQQSNKGGTV